MVNEATKYQLYDKANYIAFIARAFHITDKVGSIHPDFSIVIAQLTYIDLKINNRESFMIRKAKRMYAIPEASLAQWLSHLPCKPGVASSIPGFSSPSD